GGEPGRGGYGDRHGRRQHAHARELHRHQPRRRRLPVLIVGPVAAPHPGLHEPDPPFGRGGCCRLALFLRRASTANRSGPGSAALHLLPISAYPVPERHGRDARMKWSELAREPCSIARTISVVGDRWTLLILRDCFLRVRRFEDFQTRLGITRPILA